MVLYYDCFSGISGDMNLGAMIDLGVPEDHIRSELHKLKLEGYKIITESGQRNGITGTKVTVVVDEKEPVVHRHLADIEKIIKDSELDKSICFLFSGQLIKRVSTCSGNWLSRRRLFMAPP